MEVLVIVGASAPVLEIYRQCDKTLSELENADTTSGARIDEFLDALMMADREMVTGGSVSEETVHRINMQLLSVREWIPQCNRVWDEMLIQAEKSAQEGTSHHLVVEVPRPGLIT